MADDAPGESDGRPAEETVGPDSSTRSPGDPEGRRIARHRAHLLAEAGRVSRALEMLVQRAGHQLEGVKALTASLLEAEQTELLRAEGHIESRRRFKGGSIRRAAPPDRWLLFIDESGKSFPGATDTFALGAVAITGAESLRYKTRADELKDRFWGHHGITFHEPKMRRHQGEFAFEGDTRRQREYDAAVDQLVRDTAFKVFGVAVRKAAFAEFRDAGLDPYLPFDVYAVAIHLLLERFVDFRSAGIEERTLAKVLMEAQGPLEDAEHQRVFADVLLGGTQWVPDAAFRQWLEPGVSFPIKDGSDPMELADMVARDLFEWTEAGCDGFPGRWGLFSDRTYSRGDRSQGKFGVKVFPDSDIRDAVLAHRLECEEN